MSTREKRMLMFLGVLGLLGVVFGVYQMIWVPLKNAQAEEAKLIGDLGDKDATLEKMKRDLKRLPAAKKRSLPADVDVAKREYEATLSYLLRDSGVPAGYTIVPKDGGDTRVAPELAPKKPAYVRIGYDIRMQKVELPVLVKVLKGYYDLNLLHQITHIDVKRVEKEGSSGGIPRRGADRADLEVTLHTDAIILDGAENRRTLLPIPDGVAAVGGHAAYFAMQNLPEASRRQKTQLFPSVLATDIEKHVRDYLVMEARDPYHGTLPPVKVEKVDKVEKPIVNRIPPEDIAPFIVFNGITTSSTGVKVAMIWDRSINHLYEVSILEGDGKPEVRAKKFYYLRGQLKPLERNSDLIIGEEGTATNFTFKVHGFYEDGLVLSRQVAEGEGKDKDAKPATDPKRPNTRPGGGGGGGGRNAPPVKATKEQNALASVLGGVGMTKPATSEAVFYWRIGQTLASLKPLTADEGKEMIKKATTGTPTPVSASETPPVPAGLQN